MTRYQRLRKVEILCCHFLRNLAFYSAWYEVGKPCLNRQFWVNLNGNFLDIAVLEWCKLFGDARGKHYFGKVITDTPSFEAQLLASLHVTAVEFEKYIDQMKTYRDKFIAHLDESNLMNIPELDIGKGNVAFLYEYLLAIEADGNAFHGAPASAELFYEVFLTQGKAEYKLISRFRRKSNDLHI